MPQGEKLCSVSLILQKYISFCQYTILLKLFLLISPLWSYWNITHITIKAVFYWKDMKHSPPVDLKGRCSKFAVCFFTENTGWSQFWFTAVGNYCNQEFAVCLYAQYVPNIVFLPKYTKYTASVLILISQEGGCCSILAHSLATLILHFLLIKCSMSEWNITWR